MKKRFSAPAGVLILVSLAGISAVTASNTPVATHDTPSVAVSSPTVAAAPGLTDKSESRASRSASSALPKTRVLADKQPHLPAPKQPKRVTHDHHANLPSLNRSAEIERIRLCITHRETFGSKNPYRQLNLAGSTASGAYQITDGTWNHFMGYARAYLAPPSVQDAKFYILWDNGKGKMHWNYPPQQCW